MKSENGDEVPWVRSSEPQSASQSPGSLAVARIDKFFFLKALNSSFEKYKTKPLHRAFAITKSTSGAWTSGYAWGYATTEEAKTAALAECQKAAKDQVYVIARNCFFMLKMMKLWSQTVTSSPHCP